MKSRAVDAYVAAVRDRAVLRCAFLDEGVDDADRQAHDPRRYAALLLATTRAKVVRGCLTAGQVAQATARLYGATNTITD
jgi:hypothetical protein